MPNTRARDIVAAQTAGRHATPPAAEVSTEPTADTLGGLSERSLTFGLSHAQAAQPDPLLGVLLGDIQIEQLIAEGGMGGSTLAGSRSRRGLWR